MQIKTGRSRIYNFTCVTAVAICCPLYGRLQSLKYNRDCKVSVVSNLCSLPISILHISIFNIFQCFIFNFEHKVMDDMDDMEVSLELEYEAEEMVKPLAGRTHLKPWWASL